MENSVEILKKQLLNCRHIISKGYTCMQNTRLSWLNNFCLEFYKFTQNLHDFLQIKHKEQEKEDNEQVETVYLCLTQIVTCIKHMENTIKAEDQQGAAISSSRQHFLDRIHWCLNRLRSCLKDLASKDTKKVTLAEEKSFVELMDAVLDQIGPYSSYNNDSQKPISDTCINVAENRAQAMFASLQIRSLVDLILSHTLAFANVALKQDKRALSALCQRVLRESMAFQEECSTGIKPGAPLNDSDRKLKAISLENALYKLEDYINEALLRLVFTSFLDFQKFSIEKLRKVIQEREADDTELDELIADFDVNIDRTTQIGIFAIAFAPNNKIKTIVRSCLASFESLDSCIIPALQTKGTTGIFSHLLEQHFNEEVENYKKAIQEIIDSQAFASCYHDLLTQTIKENAKDYNKDSLEDIINMGQILYEHFQISVNFKEIQKDSERMELFKKFTLMLRECQAVLKFATEQQIETQRILKRFKILRSVLHKLTDKMGDKTGNNLENKSDVFIMSEGLSDSQSTNMFASIGITPSIRSILYNNNTTTENRRQKRLLNDSLKANTSKHSLTPLNLNENYTKKSLQAAEQNSNNDRKNLPATQQTRASLRRKESLRTALFRKQKSNETEQIYAAYKNNSDSLQISEILDQLSGLSSHMSTEVFDKSIITN